MNDGISWNFAAAVVRSDTVLPLPEPAIDRVAPVKRKLFESRGIGVLLRLHAQRCCKASLASPSDTKFREEHLLQVPDCLGPEPYLCFEGRVDAFQSLATEALATGTRWR